MQWIFCAPLLILESERKRPFPASVYSDPMVTLLTLHSPRLATVDALRQERAAAVVQVLGIVGFALLTALGAQVRIYLWEVPITMQTLFVYGSGLAPCRRVTCWGCPWQRPSSGGSRGGGMRSRAVCSR